MKWVFRLMTILMLTAAIAMPFFMDNQQGKPMLALPDPSELFPGKMVSDAATALPSPSRVVYKWQDANGVWHYGDEAPKDHSNVSTVEVDNNTNIIQGLKSTPATGKDTLDTTAPNDLKMTPAETDILSFERAANVMNDAKAAAQMMEQRNESLKAIVGEQ